MAYKTLQQLVIDIERMLYQSAGTAVQLYSQDILVDMVQNAFDHLFTKEWWPQFRVREVMTLTGTDGYFTAPLTKIKQYDDIRYVFRPNCERPLMKLPLSQNTLFTRFTDGTVPRWIEGDATNIIRVWPLQATGNVLVVGRQRPNQFLFTDTVPMDSVLLLHFAAWSYYTDDASNPESALKHQSLFEARLKQVTNDSFNEPVQLDTLSGVYPDQWLEGPYS